MVENIVLGGIIGIGVGAATGAALDHYPKPANISLERNGVRQVPVRTDPKPAEKARYSSVVRG